MHHFHGDKSELYVSSGQYNIGECLMELSKRARFDFLQHAGVSPGYNYTR
jgi:hypothetical protein